ncbi:MAG: hypothetical protein L6R35_005516 [Caloplaca aegaea]|nr:MAG: hypothetical protein L6R35_005516 [Caloplaca aegaea]
MGGKTPAAAKKIPKYLIPTVSQSSEQSIANEADGHCNDCRNKDQTIVLPDREAFPFHTLAAFLQIYDRIPRAQNSSLKK